MSFFEIYVIREEHAIGWRSIATTYIGERREGYKPEELELGHSSTYAGVVVTRSVYRLFVCHEPSHRRNSLSFDAACVTGPTRGRLATLRSVRPTLLADDDREAERALLRYSTNTFPAMEMATHGRRRVAEAGKRILRGAA